MKALRIAMALVAVLPTAAVAQREPAVMSGSFAFHSDLWMNLHHFLYHWTNHVIATERGRQPPLVVAEIATSRLSPGETEVWNRAIDQYREFATEDLLTGPKVREITDVLTSGRPAGPDWSKLRPAFTSALRNAAVIYRDHWWLTHDLMNRRWLNEVEPLLSRGATLQRNAHDTFTSALPRLYGGEWPAIPHLVDVSSYSNWSGGYTTNRPDHTIIGSNNPNMKGLAGVELVFHEVSHTLSLESGLIASTGAAFREVGRSEPSNFWHALLFYTTGELTTQFARSLRPDSTYAMLALRLGMFDRPDWRGYRAAFDAHWRPAIAGTIPPATALLNVVRALPAQPNQDSPTRIHELGHRLQSNLFRLGDEDHGPLFLWITMCGSICMESRSRMRRLP